MVNVEKSGLRYNSVSSSFANPFKEARSIVQRSSIAFSRQLTGTATFFKVPNISVNCRRINSTPSSSTICRISVFLYCHGVLRMEKLPVFCVMYAQRMAANTN